MRSVAIVATAGALTLMLSGCIGNPVESIVEQVIKDQTGVEVSAGGSDGNASLPSSWPSEVPVPDGKILLSFGADGSYSATIELDSEDAAKRGLDTYLQAGFTVTSEANLGGLMSYQLENGNFGVNYSYGADNDGKYVANIAVATLSK